MNFNQDFGNGQSSDNFAISISNEAYFVFSSTLTGATGGGLIAGAISPSVWYHVAYTQTGSTAVIYLNGVSSISGGSQYILNNVNHSINFLGNLNWAGYAPSNAEFDEVKIWNRALTAAEVLSDSSYNRSYIYTL